MRGFKYGWMRPMPFFVLGLYLGGHLSAFRPLFNTLQELETTSRKLVQELEDKVMHLNTKLQQCQRREAQDAASILVVKTQDDKEGSNEANPVCSLFATSFAPSTASIWTNYLDRIHSASQLPEDTDYSAADFTLQLLHMISPRLPLSVKTPVRETESVQPILQKAFARYQYLQRQQSPPSISATEIPPPVSILVMGGSVTKGVNCIANIPGVDRFQCAWPNRIEQLINRLFGGDLVRVNVVGMGGTNSATGATILEHDLIPAHAKNPDIIINNYATNDMHIISMRQAANGNVTLRDKVFDMTQDFVRQALQPGTCANAHRPLLLHMDDYLGNEQTGILKTTELAQGVHVLSSYYGFASMSYADMVRDWVYGDTRESLFSPKGWYNGDDEFTREIHPSVGAHSTMAWAVAYNLLNLATTYCGMESLLLDASGTTITGVQVTGQRLLHSQDTLKLNGKPRSAPNSLPPRLSKDLSLKHVSALWEKDAIKLDKSITSRGCYDRCPFSWVGGIDLEQSDEEWVNNYFDGYTTNSSDWKLHAGNQKMGFVPVKGRHGARMTLQFDNFTQPIHSVTFFTMKSYGDKWKQSRAEVRLWKRSRSRQDWDEVAVQELVGFHDKQTSETYTDVITFPEVSVADSLRISTTFVHGEKFKLMGLAVCS